MEIPQCFSLYNYIYKALGMDYMQQQDSASLVSAANDIFGVQLFRREQQALNQNNQVELLMPHPQRVLPLVAPYSPLLGAQPYLPETRSQSRAQSDLSALDFNQFQLVDEERSEDIEIPPIAPRMPQEGLNNRRAKKFDQKKTKNYMKYIIKWITRDFLSDPMVIAFELPILQALGIRKRSIKRKLLLLQKRPSTSITDMFYLILDPRITDPFKNAFARYFEFYLDNYLQIQVMKSQKLKNPSSFMQFHRRITAYLSRWRAQPLANLDIEYAPQI